MKRAVFIFLLFVSCAASAAETPCEKYLSPSSLDEVIEMAGLLETSLKSTIVNAPDITVKNEAAEHLVELEVLIDQLLEPTTSGDRAYLERVGQQIEELSHFQLRTTRPKDAPVKTNHIEMRKQAAKDFEALQPPLQIKFNMFIEEISSSNIVSPKWSYEKIRMNEITKEDCYSVRLNHGYRVLLAFNSAHGVVIYRISKSVTHNN